MNIAEDLLTLYEFNISNININSPQRAFQNQFTIIYGTMFKILQFSK